MISVFLREQKRYTQEDLVKEFRCSEKDCPHSETTERIWRSEGRKSK